MTRRRLRAAARRGRRELLPPLSPGALGRLVLRCPVSLEVWRELRCAPS